MADISQIEVASVTYDIKDATARRIATDTTVGRVMPDGITIVVNENGVITSTGQGGSYIYIHTDETSLYGQTVIVTDGVITDTATFSDTGDAVVSKYMGTGWLTITATDGTRTAYSYIDCTYYGTYRTTLGFFSATVNLSTSERSLYGGNVYVSSEVAPPQTLTFNAYGEATYVAKVPGSYTFSIV